MKLKALILATLFLTSITAAQESVIKMDVKYDNGNVTLADYTITEGYVPPQTSGDAQYLLRITNNTNTIFSTQFDIEREKIIDGPNGRKTEILNETEKRLIIPYSENSETIEIYRNRKKIIEENISTPETNTQTENNQTETNTQEESSQKTEKGLPWNIIGIAALILILVTILYLSIVPEE